MEYSLYVIDDEPSITEGIQLALEDRYRVETFATAESALASMTRDRPDLILLDVGLPGIDGIEALAEIKRHCPQTLVVVDRRAGSQQHLVRTRGRHADARADGHPRRYAKPGSLRAPRFGRRYEVRARGAQQLSGIDRRAG